MMGSLWPQTRRGVIVLVAVLLGWLWPFPYFNTILADGTINNPNELTRDYAVAALNDDRSWSNDAPIRRWGESTIRRARAPSRQSARYHPDWGACLLYRLVGPALDNER